MTTTGRTVIRNRCAGRWLTPMFAVIIGAATLAPAVAVEPDDRTPVTVTTFDRVALFPLYTAPGTTMSLNDSRVSAEISGVIQRIDVKPGEAVKAGDVLVQLDCQGHETDALAPRAELQAMRAERNLADFRRERAEKLRERGVIPLEEFQQRKAASLRTAAEVRRLTAMVERSDERVEKCQVRAPFNAVVVQRYASVGELAGPGTQLLRLVDTESLEVSSQIQEQDLDSMRQAGDIEFVSRGRTFEVKLRSVVPVLDRRVSSYEVRFEFTGETPAPGQSGRITWRDGSPHVPADLLVRRADQQGIFVAVDGAASFRVLQDALPGQPAIADLADGEQLIVDGRYGLSDGQAVRLVGLQRDAVVGQNERRRSGPGGVNGP